MDQGQTEGNGAFLPENYPALIIDVDYNELEPDGMIELGRWGIFSALLVMFLACLGIIMAVVFFWYWVGS